VKLVFPDATSFRSLIQSVASLVDEASLRFTPSGAELVAMDPAHISLITLKLGTMFFSKYEVDQEFSFGFNTSFLSKVLRFATKGEPLEISWESGSTVILRIQGKVHRVFSFRNLLITSPTVPQLNLKFDVKALVDSESFSRALDQVSEVGDTVTLSADESSLKLAAGEDQKLEVEISKELGGLREIEVNNKSSSSYAMEYLMVVTGLSKVSKEVRLQFSENKPLLLDFTMEGANVTYLLAPRLS
jgi:proliferating cell nuclear antigen